MRTRPRIRGRSALLRAGLAAACAAAVAASSQAATSSTVVTMDVPSAITVVNSCTTDAARRFGTVQPGATALTATGAGVCRVAFESSNDTAMLRASQSDATGTAMGRAAASASSTAGGTSELRGIAMSSATVGHAVGMGGSLMRTTDGGATWNGVASPTGNNLLAIDAPSASVAYAVGFNGTVLRTGDGGANWAALAGAPSGVIEGVDAISDSHVIIARGGAVHRSTDSGGSWSPIAVGGTDGFGTVAAWDADTILVGAWSGNIRRQDGGAWTSVGVMAPLALHDLEFSSATVAWAVGEGGVRRSTTAGSSWSNVSPPTEEAIRSIVTSGPTTAVVAGDRGAIWQTIDSGATWSQLVPPTANTVNAIAQVGTTIVTAGTSRTIQYSANTGATWSVPSALGDSSFGVDGESRQRAVSVGGRGTIRTTSDAGATWTARTSGTTQHLRDVDLDGALGWAVGDGGTILRTTDRGATWSAQSSGTSAALRAVETLDGMRAWAVGAGGRVLATTNGGSSWTTQAAAVTSSDLHDVSAVSSQVAWAAGSNGTLLRTTDGGATWTTRPSGTTDLLRSLVASDANAVAVLTAFWGPRRTTDAGATWSSDGGQANQFSFDTSGDATYVASVDVLRQRIATGPTNMVHWSFATFFDVDAVDENTAWAVGENDERILVDTATPFGDYGAGNLWTSSATTSLFGVCLQAVGGSASASWTVDSTGVAGRCEAADADPWRALTTTPSKVARVTSAAAGQGHVDLVFGIKVGEAVPAGRYSAGVTFEALAPDA